jgi:RNA polymerase sigma-70 factor (ECF subfamily)
MDLNWMPSAAFGTPGLETEWLVVDQARQGGAGSAEALGRICHTYWYPLYAYVRGKGFDTHEAKDLTQEFFSRLLGRPWLQDVHSSKGKFRAFLLAAMNHFLANEWRRAKAVKRGSGREMFSLDAAAAEQRYQLDPSHHESPDRLYDRSWAMTVLERASAQLRQECFLTGKIQLFESLQTSLAGEKNDERLADIACRLGLTTDAVKKAARRQRERYQEIVQAEIAQTVMNPGEENGETEFILRAVRD